MALVDCPLCDHPVPFDPAADAFDCAGCGALLPFDPAPNPAGAPGLDLPLAA